MKKNLLLVSLFAGTIIPNASLQQTTINQSNDLNEQEDEAEACTFMYVGKDVSKTGSAIVARSADAGPKGMNLNCQIFKHNELANKTVESKSGFSWKMPKTTYRYISTPRNPKVQKGLHWEASAINEKGVCASATLSCYANDAAKAADPFVSTGIGEDNLAEIVGATASSARQGIQTVASIIDNQGSDGANSIMVMDRNEA